jgi:hypothetical protein
MGWLGVLVEKKGHREEEVAEQGRSGGRREGGRWGDRGGEADVWTQ